MLRFQACFINYSHFVLGSIVQVVRICIKCQSNFQQSAGTSTYQIWFAVFSETVHLRLGLVTNILTTRLVVLEQVEQV